jgi:hypothetical protein
MHPGGVVGHQDRRAALDQLPLSYSTAMRLRDAGIPIEVIAECAGVEPDAIETFMELAEA